MLNLILKKLKNKSCQIFKYNKFKKYQLNI